MEELNREFFTDLIKDTSFVMADEGSLMTARGKVTTPLIALNCIWGGGIPLGNIVEISGHPGSGKSTFSYQTMSNYQKEYPAGVGAVLDIESSMDASRLGVLGVDTEKLLRLPATTMEQAFANLFKLLEKLSARMNDHPDLSLFCIYDTISTGGTNKQQESAADGGKILNAGGMNEAPRILKASIANLFPYLEKLPVCIGLLNQVFTQFNAYGGASVGSSGSFGLKHGAHLHISFGKPTDTWDGDFISGTRSYIELKKSKLSPKICNIPCVISAKTGGKIDEVQSFIEYIEVESLGMIKQGGGWFQFSDTIKDYVNKIGNDDLSSRVGKKYRRKDIEDMIRNDTDFLKFLEVQFINFINTIYPMQEVVNKEFRDKIISECKYLKDMKESNSENNNEFNGGGETESNEQEVIRENTDH